LWAEPLFWLGLFVLTAPLVARLVSAAASNEERTGLVAVFGLALYVVKVLHSPVAFTFPDEFIHSHNAAEAVQLGRLFEPNSIQLVSSLYPGLAGATSALTSLTGLSDFVAGIVLIGAARLVLLLSMFLLVEQVARSARVAGLTAALYAANPNFLFYSAEFGYEQLALPLAALVMCAVVRRANVTESASRSGWTVVGLLGVLALAITHHVTAYVLVAALWAACVLFAVVLKQSRRAPWDLALAGLAAVVAWLVLGAPQTLGYLGQILGGALGDGVRLLTTGESGRQLFESTSGTLTPLWEQVLGIGSVGLIVLGLPIGFVVLWRSHRANVFGLMLAAAALLYLPLQLLRLTRWGWETSTRSSEFLFIGVAFVLALALVRLHGRVSVRASLTSFTVALMATYVTVIFAGGVVAGWRSDLRLPRPYLVGSGGSAIEPEGVAVARSARQTLGSENRFAADPSNAFFLLTYGDQRPETGEARGIRSVFFARTVDRSVIDILNRAQVSYLAVDRRLISWNNLLGIYPPRPGSHSAAEDELLDPAVVGKFDGQARVSRVLDGGDVVVYDVRDLR
jgi:hypothetical protein